ncbi:MAG: vWA domain-containing protein [Tetrasphaera sp.]
MSDNKVPKRPGSALSRRPLHFIILADCSGSMAADGKMIALNTAIRETLPHLADVAAANPHAQLLLRCIAFSSGARWHVSRPREVEDLEWADLECGGYTDLGAALRLLSDALTVPPMEARAMPPAVILVSDGMPTDDFEPSLAALEALPWGKRAVRVAVGIGRDADFDVLVRFMDGGPDVIPASASNPEQLVDAIRWASVHASRAASQVAGRAEPIAPPPPAAAADDLSDVLW